MTGGPNGGTSPVRLRLVAICAMAALAWVMVARALGVLPPIVRMVAVQPVDADTMHVGMSAVVERAVDVAVAEVDRCVESILAEATG